MCWVFYKLVLKNKLIRHLSVRVNKHVWERELVVSRVTVILDLLSDGKWHGTEELLLRAGLNEETLRDVTGFLSKYGFVKVDVKSGKVKVNRDFKKLLVQTAVT